MTFYIPFLHVSFRKNTKESMFWEIKFSGLYTEPKNLKIIIIGRFPIGIKTEIRYLIICGSHNFMR